MFYDEAPSAMDIINALRPILPSLRARGSSTPPETTVSQQQGSSIGSDAQPFSSLLQIPDELLVLVGDNLELHDKFFLAQTCRKARRIFHHPLEEIAHAFVDDYNRQRFVQGVTHISRTKYFCRSCRSPHLIDHSIHEQSLPPDERLPDERWNHDRNPAFVSLEKEFKLDEIEVQLALKLARMWDNLPLYQRQFLLTLLTPRRDPESSTNKGSSRHPWVATPRIVNGRFLLQVEYDWFVGEWDGDDGKGWGWPRNRGVLCPHWSYENHNGGMPAGCKQHFHDDMRAMCQIARAGVGHSAPGSCKLCPTDYELRSNDRDVEGQTRRQLRLTSWYDLGTEMEDLLPHEDESGNERQESHFSLRRSKRLLYRSRISPEPGSIKKMFLESHGENVMGWQGVSRRLESIQ